MHYYLILIRSGNGNGTPPQYSCLANPMDGRAWWAAVHGVSKSRTRLSNFIFTFSRIGEGNGNPLQYSCLENPRDGGARWAVVYGVAQSRTRLKQLSSTENEDPGDHMCSNRRNLYSSRSLTVPANSTKKVYILHAIACQPSPSYFRERSLHQHHNLSAAVY